MLGTHADAEDVLQDAWIRWHQAAPSALCWAELVSHTPAADPSDEEISALSFVTVTITSCHRLNYRKRTINISSA
ncbi:hypothetical protein A9Y76_00240 [Ralstonia insidiosa]|jgi:DNA-directed RNA polymerase specialized sigma24 family protein|uniref:Uncharacterized protein n=1 Tax=Ralstonia insidiosa TaxID=190721 RepID=A0A191ZSD2_9RALS|nr:hypothetical protein A9Y76_00240 [Ralstonia insidiosa]